MLKNHWYVGCASMQLKSELVSAHLLDQPVVLFRDAEGKPHALLDRCCHRGFPLSKSKIRNGNIECGFHGWQYDGTGKVVRVPSQTADKAIPKAFCIPSFPCAEKDGYVWLWAGESAPTAVPEMPEINKGNWMQGSRIIECNYLRALEITFDAPHVYFLHPTHPATMMAVKHGFAESSGEVRVTDKGCIFFGPPAANESDPIPQDGFSMEFTFPGRIRFVIGGEAYMNFFTMPISETRCRMDWTIVNWNREAREPLLWTADGGDVIAEDQIALELIQKTHEREGEHFERSVESDWPVIVLRRIVQAAEAGTFANIDIPKRRIVHSMGPARFE